MVDASAVKQKVKNMPKRSRAAAHSPSHKHCRVCGIDISSKAEDRVCKDEDCIKKYDKDEKNKERLRRWMLVFFGIFAFLTVLPILAQLM
tara:strand:+ start:230 stop:499 length:270 start_codon:yes stop_codon:yes gene_type:complete